jgi:MoxR-like ATPase
MCRSTSQPAASRHEAKESAAMHADLSEAIELYKNLMIEAGKGLIGLEDVKEKVAVAFFSEIPTTLSADTKRRVNAGLVWLAGVPGVGKTYFGVVFSAATQTTFARVQGRADLTPGDVVGVELFNPKTGEWEKRLGPIVKANFLLIDEGNRIPPKSQSAFLEANQDRTVTLGDTTLHLPEFFFAMMTTNPVETGEGTYPLSAANADRFTFMVNVGYLPPEEEQKLVTLNLKKVAIRPLVTPERVIQLRSAIGEQVGLHPQLARYIRRIVVATRPSSQVNGHVERASSSLVEEYVELGASPRATVCWGPTAKTRAVLVGERNQVYPEDVQALARNILAHRLYLRPRARRAGVTVEHVIDEIIARVPIP